MKTIEITINPKGGIQVQTKGFAGTSCKEASRLIEQALGVVQADQVTPEMYHAAVADQQLRQGNG